MGLRPGRSVDTALPVLMGDADLRWRGFECSGADGSAAGVGGHLVGRFCRRAPSPTSGCTDGDAGGFQVGSSGFAPDAGFLLDAPQRPAQPPQRDDLLSLFFVQDIAHSTESKSPSSFNVLPIPIGRFSAVPHWPVLGVPRGESAGLTKF